MYYKGCGANGLGRRLLAADLTSRGSVLPGSPPDDSDTLVAPTTTFLSGWATVLGVFTLS